MQRRSFLTGLGALALGQGLMGCSPAGTLELNAYFLRGTAPGPLFRKFQPQWAGDKRNFKLDLEPLVSMAETFRELQAWYQEAKYAKTPANQAPLRVTSLGDYWLGQAIAQELIQPLNPTAWPQWSKLPLIWQQLVSRDSSGNKPNPGQGGGQVWGAPYRWGMTVIVYRQDKFAKLTWQPKDWSDLWRPELRHHFSLPDSPREVIGLALKKLGQSYNHANPQSIPELKQALTDLNRQVTFYSSDAYLQPLLRGDTWLAVGWSTDILPEARQDPALKVVVPQAGTSLFADMWVRPNRPGNAAPTVDPSQDPVEQLFNQWYNFWWQPDIAAQLSEFSDALSPFVVPADTVPLPPTQALNMPPSMPTAPASPPASGQSPIPAKGFAMQTLWSGPTSFDHHEFLDPLPAATLDQFRALWQEMRQVKG
jgi:putative spermidine/putrescine transport system substrate-binding protein